MKNLGTHNWDRENEDYFASSYKRNEKLGWIWREGWGKKMAMLGIVMTSAPFVLPPIVALSVLGLAFSVPVGFAFVTYACTDKFVSALLPMPTDDYTEEEEQSLNSSVIPDIMEGIRQAEDEISSREDELPVDSLQAVVVAADLGGDDDTNVEQVSEEVFISAPVDSEESEVKPGSKSEEKSSSVGSGTKPKASKKRSKGDKGGFSKEVNEKTYGGLTTTAINVHGTAVSSPGEGGSDPAECKTVASKNKTERRSGGTSK